MKVDPATIRTALPKPGGREAVLLREVPDPAGPRLEITLAEILPGGRGYRLERSIGIGPAIRDRFVDAVGGFRTGKPIAVATTTAADLLSPASGLPIENLS